MVSKNLWNEYTSEARSVTRKQAKIQCRVRVTRGDDIAIGPGKMALLLAIREVGSISGAARELHMSYRRAWMLVETMNACFQQPLVETVTGGRSGGGARLTAQGEKVLESYTAMMLDLERVAEVYLKKLLKANPLTGLN
jgi:molybdate transport system regulatory protein